MLQHQMTDNQQADDNMPDLTNTFDINTAKANLTELQRVLSDRDSIIQHIKPEAYMQAMLSREDVESLAADLSVIALQIVEAALCDLNSDPPNVDLACFFTHNKVLASSSKPVLEFLYPDEIPLVGTAKLDSMQKMRSLRSQTVAVISQYINNETFYYRFTKFIQERRSAYPNARLRTYPDFQDTLSTISRYYMTGDQQTFNESFGSTLPFEDTETIMAIATALQVIFLNPLKEIVDRAMWETCMDLFSNILINMSGCLAMLTFTYEEE